MWLVIALLCSNVATGLMLWQEHKRADRAGNLAADRKRLLLTMDNAYEDATRYNRWLIVRLFHVTKSHTHVGAFSDFRRSTREDYDNGRR